MPGRLKTVRLHVSIRNNKGELNTFGVVSVEDA